MSAMVEIAIRARMKLLKATSSNPSSRASDSVVPRCSEVASAVVPNPSVSDQKNNDQHVDGSMIAVRRHEKSVVSSVYIAKEKRKKRGEGTPYQRALKDRKLSVFDDMKECCKKQCWTLFDSIDIKQCRQQVHLLPSSVDRRSMVMSQLIKVKSDKPGPAKLKTAIDGIQVCDRYFKYAFGLSNDFKSRLVKYGIHSFPSPHSSQKLLWLLQWFDELKAAGEQQPNSPDIVLPFRTRVQVYGLFELDHPKKTNAKPAISFSYFNHVWTNYRSQIKLRKYLTFSKCTTCIRLREEKSKTQDAQVSNSRSTFTNLLSHTHIYMHVHILHIHIRIYIHSFIFVLYVFVCRHCYDSATSFQGITILSNRRDCTTKLKQKWHKKSRHNI
jgi:hypothetical protein